ncbi:hypothetical protein [Halomonas sp. KO116]|uniref:hypothetical protein n=1 Tax=Halomonas sp. KO116 TaxID=1504981 RepID=UPI0004E37EC8|nr:hypothetical protein [Halomonas sp. KO116]AJY53190.1 hypothetical protein KO116_P200083 [Halomonas sp. KO116]
MTDPTVQTKPSVPSALIAKYQALHDGLSEMIESGRLREKHIPDDYQWLVASLEEAAALDAKAVTINGRHA